ncbi:MAG: tyrosinase family protein [Nostoc sp. EkiNYC01]|nr:tyrosinase family protein [Nostoc sp. EkiNYC01]
MKKLLIALILVVFTTVNVVLMPSSAYAQSFLANPNVQGVKIKRAIYTRSSVFSEKGRHDLQSLANALAQMRALACQDSKSWYYQGAIHWTPGLSNFPQTNSPCEKYTEVAFNDPQQREQVQKLLEAWQHCTHGMPDQNLNLPIAPIARQNFLPWHRLYLVYFEKIVRQISQDPQFAIPYWDYTKADQRTMPPQFIEYSSLYTDLRQESLNVLGGEVEPSKQQQIDNDKNDAYKTNVFNQPPLNFSNLIENSPHGAMHNYIGGDVGDVPNPIWDNEPSPDKVGLMKDVSTAGFDPIFWIHHSSIDRYWESWQKAPTDPVQTEARRAKPGDLPLPSQVASIYTFADENGNFVSYTTPQAVIDASYNVDYRYDLLDPDAKLALRKRVFIKPTELNARLASPPSILAAGENLHQSLDNLTDVTVPLSTPLQKSPVLLDARTGNASVGQKEYLLEVKLSFPKRPVGSYSVYLNLSRNKTISSIISDIDRYYAGSVNFFDVHGEDANSKTFVFDITEEVNAQLAELKQPQAQNIQVDFVSDSTGRSEEIYVENITVRKLA